MKSLFLFVLCFVSHYDATRQHQRPISLQESYMQGFSKRAAVGLAGISSYTLSVKTAGANAAANAAAYSSVSLEDKSFEKSIFNIPPKPIQFPKEFLGTWKTDMKFQGARFTTEIPFDSISKDPNVAGFRKYSIASIPDIGTDCETLMKFVTFSKGAVIEDKSHNIKSSMNTFMQKINNIVDSIDYDEQKDPNRCVIQYHDSKGSGKIDTFTNSRTLRTNPDGSFDCSEQIRQVSVRRSLDKGRQPSQNIGDYALQWSFSPPSEQNTYTGKLVVLSYLLSQDPLYFQRPSKPVAAFTYAFTMTKA